MSHHTCFNSKKKKRRKNKSPLQTAALILDQTSTNKHRRTRHDTLMGPFSMTWPSAMHAHSSRPALKWRRSPRCSKRTRDRPLPGRALPRQRRRCCPTSPRGSSSSSSSSFSSCPRRRRCRDPSPFSSSSCGPRCPSRPRSRPWTFSSSSSSPCGQHRYVVWNNRNRAGEGDSQRAW